MSVVTRICYQSFASRHYAAPYLAVLNDVLTQSLPFRAEVDTWLFEDGCPAVLNNVKYNTFERVRQNALEAKRQGYDAFCVGHFQDAGMSDVDASLGMPILSLGDISLSYVQKLGLRIGFIGINATYDACTQAQIQDYDLLQNSVGFSSLGLLPQDSMSFFIDSSGEDDFFGSLSKSVLPLVAQGAELILPVCGILMALCAKYKIQDVVGVPIFSGIPLLVRSAGEAVLS